MDRRKDEARGRFLLRALLWLVLLGALLSRGLELIPLARGRLLPLGLSLLPLAAVLWGVYRGSLPALALLALGAIGELGALTGALRCGGADLFRSPALLASLGALLLRVLAVGAAWTPGAASGCLAARRARRTRRDLVLELVLYLAALLLSAAPWLWAALSS